MNILMLSKSYSPYVHNGRDRHVVELSQHIAGKGISVHIVTPNGGQFENAYNQEYELLDGVHVHRPRAKLSSEYYKLNLHHHNYSLFECSLALGQQRKFDLIHAHDVEVGIAALFLKRVLELPLCVTVHYLYEMNNYAYESQFEKWILPECDNIITVSHWMREQIMRLYPDTKNITVIPNGINLSTFSPGRPEIEALPHADNRKVILYVGRLSPEKGLDVLMRSVARIITQEDRLHLVVVGTGKDQFYYDMCMELGLAKHVTFLGFVNDEAILRSIYRQADVVVVPSVFEAFGLVALEAMACGAPTIVTDVGGLPDVVVNNSCGLVVPARDEQAIIDAILLVINNQNVADRFRSNGLERVKRFGWADVSSRTVDLYAAQLSKRQARPNS